MSSLKMMFVYLISSVLIHSSMAVYTWPVPNQNPQYPIGDSFPFVLTSQNARTFNAPSANAQSQDVVAQVAQQNPLAQVQVQAQAQQNPLGENIQLALSSANTGNIKYPSNIAFYAPGLESAYLQHPIAHMQQQPAAGDAYPFVLRNPHRQPLYKQPAVGEGYPYVLRGQKDLSTTETTRPTTTTTTRPTTSTTTERTTPSTTTTTFAPANDLRNMQSDVKPHYASGLRARQEQLNRQMIQQPEFPRHVLQPQDIQQLQRRIQQQQPIVSPMAQLTQGLQPQNPLSKLHYLTALQKQQELQQIQTMKKQQEIQQLQRVLQQQKMVQNDEQLIAAAKYLQELFNAVSRMSDRNKPSHKRKKGTSPPIHFRAPPNIPLKDIQDACEVCAEAEQKRFPPFSAAKDALELQAQRQLQMLSERAHLDACSLCKSVGQYDVEPPMPHESEIATKKTKKVKKLKPTIHSTATTTTTTTTTMLPTTTTSTTTPPPTTTESSTTTTPTTETESTTTTTVATTSPSTSSTSTDSTIADNLYALYTIPRKKFMDMPNNPSKPPQQFEILTGTAMHEDPPKNETDELNTSEPPETLFDETVPTIKDKFLATSIRNFSIANARLSIKRLQTMNSQTLGMENEHAKTSLKDESQPTTTIDMLGQLNQIAKLHEMFKKFYESQSQTTLSDKTSSISHENPHKIKSHHNNFLKSANSNAEAITGKLDASIDNATSITSIDAETSPTSIDNATSTTWTKTATKSRAQKNRINNTLSFASPRHRTNNKMNMLGGEYAYRNPVNSDNNTLNNPLLHRTFLVKLIPLANQSSDNEVPSEIHAVTADHTSMDILPSTVQAHWPSIATLIRQATIVNSTLLHKESSNPSSNQSNIPGLPPWIKQASLTNLRSLLKQLAMTNASLIDPAHLPDPSLLWGVVSKVTNQPQQSINPENSPTQSKDTPFLKNPAIFKKLSSLNNVSLANRNSMQNQHSSATDRLPVFKDPNVLDNQNDSTNEQLPDVQSSLMLGDMAVRTSKSTSRTTEEATTSTSTGTSTSTSKGTSTSTSKDTSKSTEKTSKDTSKSTEKTSKKPNASKTNSKKTSKKPSTTPKTIRSSTKTTNKSKQPSTTPKTSKTTTPKTTKTTKPTTKETKSTETKNRKATAMTSQSKKTGKSSVVTTKKNLKKRSPERRNTRRSTSLNFYPFED